jgi:hypothetical protein
MLLRPFLLLTLVFLYTPLFAADSLTADSSVNPNQAIFKSVQGDVRVKIPKHKKLKPALKDMVLVEGDKVVTGLDGTAVLRMFDGSEVAVSSDTQFQIAHLEKNEAGDKILQFKLLLGKVISTVEKLTTSRSSFEIEAGGVVCGVRGTQFSMLINAITQQLEVAVQKGSVFVNPIPPPPPPGQPPKNILKPAQQIINAGQTGLFTIQLGNALQNAASQLNKGTTKTNSSSSPQTSAAAAKLTQAIAADNAKITALQQAVNSATSASQKQTLLQQYNNLIQSYNTLASQLNQLTGSAAAQPMPLAQPGSKGALPLIPALLNSSQPSVPSGGTASQQAAQLSQQAPSGSSNPPGTGSAGQNMISSAQIQKEISSDTDQMATLKQEIAQAPTANEKMVLEEKYDVLAQQKQSLTNELGQVTQNGPAGTGSGSQVTTTVLSAASTKDLSAISQAIANLPNSPQKTQLMQEEAAMGQALMVKPGTVPPASTMTALNLMITAMQNLLLSTASQVALNGGIQSPNMAKVLAALAATQGAGGDLLTQARDGNLTVTQTANAPGQTSTKSGSSQTTQQAAQQKALAQLMAQLSSQVPNSSQKSQIMAAITQALQGSTALQSAALQTQKGQQQALQTMLQAYQQIAQQAQQNTKQSMQSNQQLIQQMLQQLSTSQKQSQTLLGESSNSASLTSSTSKSINKTTGVQPGGTSEQETEGVSGGSNSSSTTKLNAQIASDTSQMAALQKEISQASTQEQKNQLELKYEVLVQQEKELTAQLSQETKTGANSSPANPKTISITAPSPALTKDLQAIAAAIDSLPNGQAKTDLTKLAASLVQSLMVKPGAALSGTALTNLNTLIAGMRTVFLGAAQQQILSGGMVQSPAALAKLMAPLAAAQTAETNILTLAQGGTLTITQTTAAPPAQSGTKQGATQPGVTQPGKAQQASQMTQAQAQSALIQMIQMANNLQDSSLKTTLTQLQAQTQNPKNNAWMSPSFMAQLAVIMSQLQQTMAKMQQINGANQTAQMKLQLQLAQSSAQQILAAAQQQASQSETQAITSMVSAGIGLGATSVGLGANKSDSILSDPGLQVLNGNLPGITHGSSTGFNTTTFNNTLNTVQQTTNITVRVPAGEGAP